MFNSLEESNNLVWAGLGLDGLLNNVEDCRSPVLAILQQLYAMPLGYKAVS